MFTGKHSVCERVTLRRLSHEKPRTFRQVPWRVGLHLCNKGLHLCNEGCQLAPRRVWDEPSDVMKCKRTVQCSGQTSGLGRVWEIPPPQTWSWGVQVRPRRAPVT